MIRSNRIRTQAAELLGEPVRCAAIVFTPVSWERSNDHHTPYPAGKPGDLLKHGERLTGMASELPDARGGVLAMTDTHVHFLEMKVTGRPTEVLLSWLADELDVEFRPKEGWGGYRGLLLTFADGTEALLEGEGGWGIKTFQ